MGLELYVCKKCGQPCYLLIETKIDEDLPNPSQFKCMLGMKAYYQDGASEVKRCLHLLTRYQAKTLPGESITSGQ